MTVEKFSVDVLRSDVAAAKAQGRILMLTNASVVEAIRAFSEDLISKEELANWADFFDVNEDIELESDVVLPDVLFELASPEINGWPDEIRAAQLVTLLTQ